MCTSGDPTLLSTYDSTAGEVDGPGVEGVHGSGMGDGCMHGCTGVVRVHGCMGVHKCCNIGVEVCDSNTNSLVCT
jgi:hypothetical protein